MPFLNVGGARLYVLDQGHGSRTVVLLHAFPLHGRMWADQVAALQGEARLVAPDARGLGKSGPVPEALTMEMLAADTAEVLAQLGVRRAVVVGLSMGGYAALALHRARPELLEALVLADTRATADTGEGRAAREAFAAAALEKGMRWVAEEMLGKLLSPAAPPAIREKVRRMIQENTPAAVAAAQRGMALRPDATTGLAAIACPTLCLVGAEDRLTPPSDAEAMAAAIPGARLAVIPGAGHLANVEAAAAFSAELRSFLASLPGA